MQSPNINKNYVVQYRKELGQQINQARISANLSEIQLAEAVGLSEHSIVNKLETGSFAFSIDIYVKVAITLNLKIALR